jgi:GTP-binding protein HflX
VKRIWVSAKNRQGLELIHQVLADHFKQDLVRGEICLSPADARVRALLFGINAVEDERIDDNGQFILQLNVPYRDLMQMVSRESVPQQLVLPADYKAPQEDWMRASNE